MIPQGFSRFLCSAFRVSRLQEGPEPSSAGQDRASSAGLLVQQEFRAAKSLSPPERG